MASTRNRTYRTLGRGLYAYESVCSGRDRTLGRALYAYEAVCRGPQPVTVRLTDGVRTRSYETSVHLVFIMPQAYWCEPHEAGLGLALL